MVGELDDVDAFLADLMGVAAELNSPEQSETQDTQAPETNPDIGAPPADEKAPPLVVSAREPTPEPCVEVAQLQGSAPEQEQEAEVPVDHEVAQYALMTALKGGQFDYADIPSSKVIALGVAKALVRSGVDADLVVSSIIESMEL